MANQHRGLPLTQDDRTCLAIMLTSAEAKGWRSDVRKGQNGFAELIRLFPPGATHPAHAVARLDEHTIALLDNQRLDPTGEFLTVMDALGAISRIVAEAEAGR